MKNQGGRRLILTLKIRWPVTDMLASNLYDHYDHTGAMEKVQGNCMRQCVH